MPLTSKIWLQTGEGLRMSTIHRLQNPITYSAVVKVIRRSAKANSMVRMGA